MGNVYTPEEKTYIAVPTQTVSADDAVSVKGYKDDAYKKCGYYLEYRARWRTPAGTLMYLPTKPRWEAERCGQAMVAGPATEKQTKTVTKRNR